ncbi:MAG: hypothetical protein Q9163_006339, partial [Psora crenata]
PEAQDPVPRSRGAVRSLTWKGLEGMVPVQELSLLLADNKQLLILGLEEANANGKVERHCPKLDSAGKIAVERVYHKDHEEIDVQDEDGHQSQIDLAHSDHWMASVTPYIGARHDEKDGIGGNEDDLSDGVAIVVRFGPVMASRVEVASHDELVLLLRDDIFKEESEATMREIGLEAVASSGSIFSFRPPSKRNAQDSTHVK